ncbi:CCE_0567 family metalloprotein [Methylobacterium sp. WSM2598]|uniref:CCE_0567 family metalloprotein n=1 Tax=Methylobacterium sp. WSM2598 TaxID=398261 RepID=UPI00037F0053|nr:CCE_0567 family metalloprotein [Methylobacterium sp. WSM2598]
MSDIETLKAEIKKLSSRSVTAKMNLHDLSEDLPTNWQSILRVAHETYDAFQALDAARRALKAAEA